MHESTFLLQFQEHINASHHQKHDSNGTRTFTKAREEPDQDNAALSMATRTRTEAREEPDQDVSGGSYAVFLRSCQCSWC
jgi:hypothetical protein